MSIHACRHREACLLQLFHWLVSAAAQVTRFWIQHLAALLQAYPGSAATQVDALLGVLDTVQAAVPPFWCEEPTVTTTPPGGGGACISRKGTLRDEHRNIPLGLRATTTAVYFALRTREFRATVY